MRRRRASGRHVAAPLAAAGIARLLAAGIAAPLAAGIALALSFPAPAAAHGVDRPGATDYRTEVTGLAPTVPGLTVHVVEAGARLRLTNHTGRPIEVLGYQGEPFLEVRPDGVYENVHSPATYLNRSPAQDPPADANPALPPSWRRVSTEPVARWHDQRAHWLGTDRPPQVHADPTRPHRIRDWVVPLRDGTSTIEVRGTLDWIPPPDPRWWWVAALLGAAAVTALARAPRRVAVLALGGLTATGGAAALAFAAGRASSADPSGPGHLLLILLANHLWTVLAGLGALAAAGYALARRSAEFALALNGTCLALFAGTANAEVLARAVVPVPGPAWWARLAIVAVLATGAGVAAASTLRLRRAASRSTAEDAPSPARHAPVDAG